MIICWLAQQYLATAVLYTYTEYMEVPQGLAAVFWYFWFRMICYHKVVPLLLPAKLTGEQAICFTWILQNQRLKKRHLYGPYFGSQA